MDVRDSGIDVEDDDAISSNVDEGVFVGDSDVDDGSISGV